MRIRAFKAWRPKPELAEQVAAVPYDVVDTREARGLTQGKPWSFLHVSRPDVDLPDSVDIGGPEAHAQAREALAGFMRKGALIREPEPCLYVYRLVMGSHIQHGLVACCAVDEYRDCTIKTHEKTRQDKEDDRTRHIESVNAHDEPIFIAYRDSAAIDAQVAALTATDPLYDFTAPDGIRNTLWRLPATDAMVNAFTHVPAAYIADGHHRAAASVRVSLERRRRTGAPAGSAEADWFMAVLFPAGQLRILPYNRVVHDLNGLSAARFLDLLRASFTVRADAPPQPERAGHVSMYLDGRWYDISWTPPVSPDPLASLDVSVLQDRVLAALLGIRDPRTSQRIEFVGGIRGPEDLVRRVSQRPGAVAFSMYPASLDQLMRIADAGGIMPPKSTWFEPKLRSGLFVHSLD